MGPGGPGLGRQVVLGLLNGTAGRGRADKSCGAQRAGNPGITVVRTQRAGCGHGRCDLHGPPWPGLGSGPPSSTLMDSDTPGRASRWPRLYLLGSHGSEPWRLRVTPGTWRVMTIWMGGSGSELSFINHIPQGNLGTDTSSWNDVNREVRV